MTAAFADASVPIPRHGRDKRPHIVLAEHAPNADIAAVLHKPYSKRTAAEKRLVEGKAAYFTRASTLAKALDDGAGLVKWKAAMTLIGAAKSPAIVKAAKVLTDWKQADELVEQSCTLAGAGDKATEGTTLHRLTELVDANQALPDGLDDDTLRSLAAYRQATATLTPLAAETFVVNDDVTTAGTFDRLWQVPAADPWPEWLHGRRPVGDLKTGSLYVQSVAIQLAIYANGSLYNPADASRIPLGADQQFGLIMHLPQGEARCDVWAVDLTAGAHGARLARAAKDFMSWGNKDALAHRLVTATPEGVAA